MIAYANSKLCNVLFAYELARRLRRSPNLALTSNAMHPGFVATDIGKNNGLLVSTAVSIYHRISLLRGRSITPDQSARTLMYMASDPELAGVSGKYFVEGEAKGSSVTSYDHDLAAHLWGISELILQRCLPVLAETPQVSKTSQDSQAAKPRSLDASSANVSADASHEI